MAQKAIASSGQPKVVTGHVEVSYRTVVSSGQYSKNKLSYDTHELQRAIDARNEWVRVQLSRYGSGELDEPTKDFEVTIDGEQWQVVQCGVGDLCRLILLQKGAEYMLHDDFWNEWLWVRFATDATSLASEAAAGCEPFPLVNVQRARALSIMLDLWS